MVAARERRLVTGHIAEVDPQEEAKLRELLERAVDAREPDGAPLGAQPVEDLGRAQAAPLPRQMLDYRLPRLAPASHGRGRRSRPTSASAGLERGGMTASLAQS